MISEIFATKTSIIFITDNNKELTLKAFSPATGENVLLGEFSLKSENGTFEIDREIGGRDGAFLRFESDVGGVKYVGRVEPEFKGEYPDPGTKKGLQVVNVNDAIELGVRYAAMNVAINDFMRSGPTEEYMGKWGHMMGGTIEYNYHGKTYYINKHHVFALDRKFKELTDAGIIVTLILLAGKRWRTEVPEDMKKIVLHPDYDDEGTLSAFNTVTDEGVTYYEAWISFMMERWGVENGEYGRVYGMIISNEVQSQWIWGNAGHKTVEEFARDYTQALRIAYIAGTSVFENMRVYISLDHFWEESMHPEESDKYYGAKELLTVINDNALKEGNFYWNIAHHPYPEDLTKPDFWNDETATDSPDTVRITFKNLEILAQFIYDEKFLFNGKRRRIILSEQGFNSKWTPESEILQATAYGRAYRKVMEIPEIDAFILHAHYDSASEFGLNLGLWRRYKEDEIPEGKSVWDMDRPKPIYYLFKEIDKKDDTGKYTWERF